MRPNSKTARTRPPQNLPAPGPGLSAIIRWQGFDTRFQDARLIEEFRITAERLPVACRRQISQLQPGECLRQRFPAGVLVDHWRESLRLVLPRSHFRPDDGTGCTPGYGRFYPLRCFAGLPLPSGRKPAFGRIIGLDETRMTLDLNHPLAGKPLDLEIRCHPVIGQPRPDNHPARSLTALLCDGGPGMQDRLAGGETDFRDGHPFARLDEGDDAAFFREPSLTPYWGRPALQQVSQLYRHLIRPGERVLDLMAGVHSPLQEAAIDDLSVTCAGLNRIELAHNPVCHERRTLNVNRDLPLPWPERHFDTVLIHAAIEYVTRPAVLLDEIHRLLKPGGRLIISFSDHWVEAKVIRIWPRLFPFERSGLLLAWLRRQGGFTNLHASSVRGVPAGPSSPEQDEPVHAVWAEKRPD
jgi:SAM-dependent methyltransferase